MKIQYISWNYGIAPNPKWYADAGYCKEYLHLIRYTDGSGVLKTTDEMITMGLVKK